MKKLLVIAGIVFAVALCSSRARAIISEASGVLSGSANNVFSPPLSPVNGGVGASTGSPFWARYLGTGVESAGPASGTLTCGEHDYTTWTVTGAIASTNFCSINVRVQGAFAANTGASFSTSGKNSVATSGCDLGGAGGSGGSEGAVNSVATKGCTGSINIGNVAIAGIVPMSGAAAASSSSPGVDGGAIPAPLALQAFTLGPNMTSLGGGSGSAGANAGGAAGNGSGYISIVAQSITIASGVTFDTSGKQGVDAAALTTGGGGGGGGGMIWLNAQTFTDNGAIYKYGGGPGGNCTTPSISVTGGGCDTTGCGKDASIIITALVGGGLSAANMTLTSGGSGYKTAPICTVNAGASGLTGSPACHFAAPSAGAIALPVIDTAGSGGTLTSFAASCQLGGYGANGAYAQQLIQ